jgi:CheY-like chemotaxis protein
MAKKILLADDSLTIQKVVELTFSDSDYELFAVSNGQKALDRVREYRPDLILADAVMPEKNGYEVCEAIKADPSTAAIPVILLSGTFEPFDRERAERIGADAIVSKPFDSQQLLAQVDALLDRSPATRAYSPAAAEPFPVPQTTADVAMTHDAPPPPEVHGHGLGHGGDHEAGDDGPFDTGFSAEDFTASIRKPSHRAAVDPFEEEYGARGDVDSAIEAFEKSQAAGAAAAHEPAPAPEEPREPSWLREESERPAAVPSFFPDREVSEKTEPLVMPAEPFDSGMASPPLHTNASMPSFDDVPPDQMPTLELPQLRFHREREEAAERAREERARENSETVSSVHAALSGFEPHEPHPVPEPPAPMRSGAVEISEHEARDLFEVGSSPEPMRAEVEAEAAQPAGHEPEPGPEPAVAPAQTAAAPGPVPGEIEMLAQRSSIPELTQMLSSVRSVDMTDEQIERLATRVVEKLSDRIVREIAWEVIPDMAEIVIKQRIKELESGIE